MDTHEERDRTLFAAIAMQGYLVNADHFAAIFSKADNNAKEAERMIATASFDMADAMIAERKHRKEAP